MIPNIGQHGSPVPIVVATGLVSIRLATGEVGRRYA